MISNLTSAYFENKDSFEQLAACMGLDEHPDDYRDIVTILGSMVATTIRPSTMELMITEIKQYSNLVKSLFIVKQYIKGVNAREVKENFVEMIYDDSAYNKIAA